MHIYLFYPFTPVLLFFLLRLHIILFFKHRIVIIMIMSCRVFAHVCDCQSITTYSTYYITNTNYYEIEYYIFFCYWNGIGILSKKLHWLLKLFLPFQYLSTWIGTKYNVICHHEFILYFFVCVPNQVNWNWRSHYTPLHIHFHSFFGMSAGHHHPSQQIVLNLSWVAFKLIIDCDVKKSLACFRGRQVSKKKRRLIGRSFTLETSLIWLLFAFAAFYVPKSCVNGKTFQSSRALFSTNILLSLNIFYIKKCTCNDVYHV